MRVDADIDTIKGINENIKNGSDTKETVADAITDIGSGITENAISAAIARAISSFASPVAGVLVGGIADTLLGTFSENADVINGQTPKDWKSEKIEQVISKLDKLLKK